MGTSTVRFEYTDLLRIQRDLCDLPRGSERFNQYIRTMRGSTTDDMELPLSAFNPMGKQHVAEILDAYLCLTPDDHATSAIADVARTCEETGPEYRVALVLADDAKGGWTNRFATEFDHRFGGKANHRRGWTTGLLWTSEEPSEDWIRNAASEAVLRADHVARHGYARTLREMLLQLRFTQSATRPKVELDDEELDYSFEVIKPLLNTDVKAEQIACLFGDEAAEELGYKPCGLSVRAGFALASSRNQLHSFGQ